MLKVVNVIRLYLRDLQSRSFVFVFFVMRSVGKKWKTTETTGTTLKIEKKSCLSCSKLSFKKNSCKLVKSVPKKKNDSKRPLKMSKSMVVSVFFRNFAVHLREMHAQADSTRSMRGEYQRRERYGPDSLRCATGGKRSGHREIHGMHCRC